MIGGTKFTKVEGDYFRTNTITSKQLMKMKEIEFSEEDLLPLEQSIIPLKNSKIELTHHWTQKSKAS